MNNNKKLQKKQGDFNDTLLPNNREAEEALLSCLFLEPDSLEQVRDDLSPDDFYLEKHKIIYQAILDLTDLGDPVTIISLDNLFKSNDIDIPVSYLTGLQDIVPTSGNIRYYAEIIKNLSRRRGLIDIGKKIEVLGRDPELSLEELLYRTEELVRKVSSEGTRVLKTKPLTEVLNFQATPHIIKGILPQGGGLIVASESGIGKSMLLLDVAISLADGAKVFGRFEVEAPQNVLILQCENSWDILKARLERMRRESALPENIFISERGEDLKLADEKGKPLARNIGRIISAARQLKARVLIYDPLISFHTVDENDNSKMRSVLDTISYINEKTKASAIVTHHFGKGWGTDEGQRTRGASAIRDWADTLVTLSLVKNKQDLLKMSFQKIRDGAPLEPVTLERKDNFRHRVINLVTTLCPPSKVREILMDLGGKVEKKSLLYEEIEKSAECCRSTAMDSVKEALKLRLIEERNEGKKRVIFVKE